MRNNGAQAHAAKKGVVDMGAAGAGNEGEDENEDGHDIVRANTRQQHILSGQADLCQRACSTNCRVMSGQAQPNSFIRSSPSLSLHSAWYLLLERQG